MKFCKWTENEIIIPSSYPFNLETILCFICGFKLNRNQIMLFVVSNFFHSSSSLIFFLFSFVVIIIIINCLQHMLLIPKLFSIPHSLQFFKLSLCFVKQIFFHSPYPADLNFLYSLWIFIFLKFSLFECPLIQIRSFIFKYIFSFIILFFLIEIKMGIPCKVTLFRIKSFYLSLISSFQNCRCHENTLSHLRMFHTRLTHFSFLLCFSPNCYFCLCQISVNIFLFANYFLTRLIIFINFFDFYTVSSSLMFSNPLSRNIFKNVCKIK